FAHVASHDLQEPLRMISSYTELLERRYRDALDERARKYIDYAADGARRMQSMISGLLEYSRVAQLEDEPGVVDLNEILATVRRDLSVALEEEGGTLEVASLPLVRGDPDRLAQVFRNLIANAIKFRGEVDPEIRVTAEDCGGTWRVGVHDNGIGIEPEYFDQIFVVFKRLNSRREYAGAGVGLALCRKIVEHHGGRMEVESRPGEGSSFYLTLPGVEPA
ncbi:MAG: ATP-binding protein, partial [Longimicrobiales bacterium]|nr:ATP-binding protein [Longimicrobiales bacterium]